MENSSRFLCCEDGKQNNYRLLRGSKVNQEQSWRRRAVKNLVIVESPAKATTIQRFLGAEFQVMSSFGHIRDLVKSNDAIDVSNGFAPTYEVPSDKAKVVSALKKAVKASDAVWLASDEDREGEAIAWHLAVVLGLNIATTKRIVFHEITKKAIQHAIENPRTLDLNLVDAQQARRILDRLVGFEVSPILWRKVQPKLSAGRVQSVAVRLIADREREIQAFEAERYYRVQAVCQTDSQFKAELTERLQGEEAARAYVQGAAKAHFVVGDVKKTSTKRTPAPPFTTSTLQQEASRKLGFSAANTMSTAQKLYEAGHITYMRTDSVNLSSLALGEIGRLVEGAYGAQYHQVRQYHTKSKGAQEAHEAIRPTHVEVENVGMGAYEQRLYDLIRKRAIASQMADARLQRTTVQIVPKEGNLAPLVAQGEVIEFDGFLKVYIEGSDDDAAQSEGGEGMLPKLTPGQPVTLVSMVARERYTLHPPRFTEASLVKRMEELGIGRPSTYAPTIATIMKREYVMQDSRDGTPRKVWECQLANGRIEERHVVEMAGGDRRKLFPTDIGLAVNDFLVEHFPSMMDYNFTAEVEAQFDKVAEGELGWVEMLEAFYGPFHERVEKAQNLDGFVQSERQLGVDPASGKPVIVRIGRYGPIAQIGLSTDEEKPRYASLLKNQLIETITLEEALKLFALPRTLGEFEGKTVTVAVGRFGPYVRHDGKFASLRKDQDPLTIELPAAIELIEAKRKSDLEKILRTFPEEPELQVLRGRYNRPYIHYKGDNYALPKEFDYKKATLQELLDVVAKAPAPKKRTAATTKKSSTATKRKPKK